MPASSARELSGEGAGEGDRLASVFGTLKIGGPAGSAPIAVSPGPAPTRASAPLALAKRSLAVAPPASLPPILPEHKELNLLLSVERPVPGGGRRYVTESCHALPRETIHTLRLRLKNRGLFSGRHYLVFGSRKLLEHETVGDVAAQSADSDYLHVFAKVSDVATLEVATAKGTMVLDNGAEEVGRARHGSLSRALQDGREPGDSLRLRGRVVGYDDDVEEVMDSTVIHLLIRKSAKLAWQHVKDDWFELSISATDTVAAMQTKIEAVSSIRADRYRFLSGGEVLPPSVPLASVGIGKGSVVELVPFEMTRVRAFPDGSPRLSHPDHKLFQHWQAAKDALAKGVAPKLAPAGTGGSYFIFANDGTKVAVLKPKDEEPNGPNNPKGFAGSPDGGGLRKGVRPGEGAVREVMAYVLDHGNFSGVPPTAMVTLKVGGEKKVCSFQQFIPHESDCEDMGPAAFPPHQVHKIAILDVRLANTDRNGGNILAWRSPQDGGWWLTPIDHGYCMPSTFEDLNFEWLYWPQAKMPLGPEARAYIDELDADRDLTMLAEQGLALRRECERVYKVCTLLLKKCVARGLSLYQIGTIMTRATSQKSDLEKMNKRATQLAVQEEYGDEAAGVRAAWVCSDAAYIKHMASLVDQYLDDSAPTKGDAGHDDVFG
ncbi:unnamed protein product [Ostreobium quekettii]|uniref:1-phosphatidylinositol 4-kinase n=1 Tax=Ostreobium quekettii TaxID=121088 RepID=A0A8S1JEH8_9CHLO|nr:unnamed protein product [Ostreobium quekettii]|eukprot:evm.model.scf_1559.2 EVM.evm.TU.scf_1559.2   scf_1559:31828-33804(-)